MVIDKSKGIVAKPMPRVWYDRHSVNVIEDEDKKRFYRDIVADKKPYFMRYIYPDLMKQYNTYIKNTDKSSMREFGMTVKELSCLPYDSLTDRQKDFLRYYDSRMPVGVNNCVMNVICRKIENEFDGFIKSIPKDDFDYSVLKNDDSYTSKQFNDINKLYNDYVKRLRSRVVSMSYDRTDSDEASVILSNMMDEFIIDSINVCSSESVLANILIDICYSRSSTKKFVWSTCSDSIVNNVISRCGGVLEYPTADANGDILFCGNTYSLKKVKIGECDDTAE